MQIENILELLPKELLYDDFVDHIIEKIINHFQNPKTKLLSQFTVSESIYNSLANKNNLMISKNDTILSFSYQCNDEVISIGIKKCSNHFAVYFESQELEDDIKILLIKSASGSVIQTKKTKKQGGIISNYEIELYYYNSEYRLIKTDIEPAKDKLFSDEFKIPLSLSRYMRRNFSKYRVMLSQMQAEVKMQAKEAKMAKEEFFLFKGPTTINDLKSFIVETYLEKNNLSPKYLDRIDFIILKLSEIIESTAQIIIGSNILINLIPSITGIDAAGYHMNGYIVQKEQDNFILYELQIKTDNITYAKKVISIEELQLLLSLNSANNNNSIQAFINPYGRK